jgi:AcrR family transcriptional regulator
MVLSSTKCKKEMMARPKKPTGQEAAPSAGLPARTRIMHAAYSAFMERGYQQTSTLHIATRAKVSKRELYALFDNKHAMLVACIVERTAQMRMPLTLPPAQNRMALAATLTAFGGAFLRGLCDPHVLALQRFAIAEANTAPEIAQALDQHGRLATRDALIEFLRHAQANGLLGAGDTAVIAERFFALVWGGLWLRLLLRVSDAPPAAELDRRAKDATEALLAIYPAPAKAT